MSGQAATLSPASVAGAAEQLAACGVMRRPVAALWLTWGGSPGARVYMAGSTAAPCTIGTIPLLP